MTISVIGEQDVRDLNFSRGQHNEGGANVLSLAAFAFPNDFTHYSKRQDTVNTFTKHMFSKTNGVK